MESIIPIVAAVLLGGLGFAVGRSNGRKIGVHEGRGEADGRLRTLIDAVKRGRSPEGAKAGSAEAELHAALGQGWAPREVEREAALREAIGRVSAFLDKSVRAPLSGGSADSDASDLRERIDRALGDLQDVDFFLTELGEARESTDMSQLAQAVSREFAADHEMGVRLMLSGSTVRAMVNRAAMMDALYLILHNAARFGGGATIDLSVENAGGKARIRIRDRGEGFTPEAFKRAFDPFYSTSEEGLGLGLPHARKVVEGMGGTIELRNVPDGGAEVEISFPSA